MALTLTCFMETHLQLIVLLRVQIHNSFTDLDVS